VARRKAAADQQALFEARVTTAPAVPAIRKAVSDWRDARYKGATETSKLLLRYWFTADHRLPNGSRFKYHYFQRDALETLVYLYEVAQVRRHKDLLEQYAPNIPGIHLLQYDQFARYAVKMATGSGKTKVMSLVVAWQYLNAIVEERTDYASTFLVIAPNVIVFERLRSDFGSGNVFRADPVLPPELADYWNLDCYVRGEAERGATTGALYLTNVQQLYERPDADDDPDEPDPIAAVLGRKPPANLQPPDAFFDRVVRRRTPCLVLNDEGHHTHDEENEWNRVVRRLAGDVPGGLTAQIDFTATPRYQKGGLFTWTVFDYPLKQAILDNVVKRPVKGITAGIREQPSEIASVRYRAYLTAGVERYREYREQLKPLAKKPILFVMMNSTAEADEVADYLRVKYPDDFGAGENNRPQLLVIHTDRTGEVSKKDLVAAREAARRVDEGSSSINAIVSVLMLREGWDVQAVTVLVGLRPFTATANILPEQAIGRGLRLMFGNVADQYVERVDVIGNAAFSKFVEQLERDEEITLDTADLKEPLVITTIAPDPDKFDRDIALPVLSPVLARKKSLADEIQALDVRSFKSPRLPMKQGDKAAEAFHYEGVDIITLEKLVERDYTIPEPQTAEEVISYYAKRIAQEVKLPSQFANLVPKVQEFLRFKAFGTEVDLADKAIVRAVATSVAQYVTIKTFAAALKSLVVEELEPSLGGSSRRLSETPPFPFSRPTFSASKTVFNLVAADNEFERSFARFLNEASDVAAFAKLPLRFGFAIEYTDSAASLRYYEPDFVAVDVGGDHLLLETKGREDVDVAHKDRAARIWADNATLLTGVQWRYVKVMQADFEKLRPDGLADLRLALDPEGLWE
jgi:type III restriction enzyme